MRPALYRDDDELLYKEDYRQARQRIEAFCEGEVLDRVCLSVTAPRRGTHPPAAHSGDVPHRPAFQMVEVPEFPSNEVRHTDLEFILQFHHAWLANTFWGGEALPVARNDLGFVSTGLPDVTFLPESPWGHPWLQRCSVDDYQFDPGNRWWRQTYDIHMALLEDSQGKYFPGEPALIPPTDLLAGIRGPGDLCLDMIDDPDGVHEVLDHLTQVHRWRMERVYEAIAAEKSIPVGSPEGRDFTPSADFSRNDSPEGRLLLPPWCHKFRIQCDFAQYFERVEYHLDGRQNLAHLPAVLEIDEVNYVQWVPRPGDPQGLYWQDVWQAVRATGRGMQTSVPFDQVEQVLREWGPKGLWLTTTAPTEEAATDLLKHAETWSCQHPWDVR